MPTCQSVRTNVKPDVVPILLRLSRRAGNRVGNWQKPKAGTPFLGRFALFYYSGEIKQCPTPLGVVNDAAQVSLGRLSVQ